VGGHGLDRLRRRFTVKAVRGKRIERLVFSKETRQLQAVEPATSPIAVEEDKGRPRPSALDFDEWRSPFDGYLAFAENICQMLERRPAKQGGQWDPIAAGLLDLVHHFGGEERVSAQFEEVIGDPDGANAKNLFPYTDQLVLQRIWWPFLFG